MISLTATAEDEEFKSDEELSISDILPDDSIWGISIEAFQQTFPGTYKSSNVGNSPALIQEHLNIEGYDMNSYYVFADDSLSKITYILVDDSNKSVVKSCTSHLVSAMETALGTTATKSKGVSKWNNSSIQIGTAKLKNYTGKDSLSACIIFKGNESTSAKRKEPNKGGPFTNRETHKDGDIEYETAIDFNLEEKNGYYGAMVIVEVTNIGNIPIYLDSSTVFDYEDNNGHLLESDDFIYQVPEVVQPGEKGYLFTSAGFSVDTISNGCNLVPSLSIKRATRSSVRHEVTDTSLFISILDEVGVRGRIVNENPEAISIIYPWAIFYDKEGSILGIGGVNVLDVPAQSKKSFEISGCLIRRRPFSIEDVADYTVYAEETYYQ